MKLTGSELWFIMESSLTGDVTWLTLSELELGEGWGTELGTITSDLDWSEVISTTGASQFCWVDWELVLPVLVWLLLFEFSWAASSTYRKTKQNDHRTFKNIFCSNYSP